MNTVIHKPIIDDNKIDSIGEYFIDNLKILESIKSGNKIYYDKNTEKICIDDSFILQGIWRYYNNVSRHDTIFIINKLINDIEIYVNAMYLKETDKQHKNKMFSNKLSSKLTNIIITFMDRITKSVKGIENLKLTYETDTDLIQNLTKLIEKSHTLVNSLKKMLF